MRNLKNYAFMGFGKVVNSEDVNQSEGFKKYIGIAPVNIIAVNPTKEELSSIYGREVDKDPVYLSKSIVMGPNGSKEVNQIRLDFIVRTDKEDKETLDIDMISKISLFLSDSPRYTKDMSQLEVINDFGETIYMTPAQFKGEEPIPSNKSWFSTAGMRISSDGEGTLMALLRAYLALPMKSYKDRKTGQIVEIENLDDAKCGIANLKPIFVGNVSSISAAIKLAPKNKIRVAIGVKSSNGREFQDIFTRKFNKYGNQDISKIWDEIVNSKGFGAYPNTEFNYNKGLVEYLPTATDFSDMGGVPNTPNMPGSQDDDEMPF